MKSKIKQEQHFPGIIALAVLALVYGLTAIMARYFSTDMTVFEQWYVRFFVASCVLAIVFRKQIRYRKIRRSSPREKKVTIARGLLGYVAAAGLYALSTHYATIGAVAAMQIVPMTALFGVLILHEKITRRQLLLIVTALFGASLIVVRSFTELHFGLGELLSLGSEVLFALVFVLRKKQTGELNNYELSLVMLGVGCIVNYVLALVTTGHTLPRIGVVGPEFWFLIICAGVLSVLMSLLSNYGFEQVKATTANVILNLELVFGIAFGYALYKELLTAQQLIGAALILFAAITIGYLEAKYPTKS